MVGFKLNENGQLVSKGKTWETVADFFREYPCVGSITATHRNESIIIERKNAGTETQIPDHR